MKTRIFCLMLLVVGTFNFTKLNGQSAQLNLDKYWHYRYRLVNYFMVVGFGQGKSLPATVRNKFHDGVLDWGETPRYLGWYLGVLATEYRLLKNNGQSVDQMLTELHYALVALERLDKEAEPTYGNFAPSLNGFLIADDVDENFVLENDLKLNKDLINNLNASHNYTQGSGEPHYVNEVSSHGLSPVPASLDQIAELLIGLALVKKCVDNEIMTFPNEFLIPISDNLCQRAIDETHRILTYIKTNEDENGNTVHWRTTTPLGEIIGDGDGGDFRAMAHGFAKAGEFITGTDYTDIHSEGFPWIQSWQNLQNIEFERCEIKNLRIGLDFASVCDCWNGTIFVGFANTTKEGIKYQGDFDAGASGFCEDGGTYPANHYGFDLFYGAVHRYLHDYDIGDALAIDLCSMQSILNSAPWDGPFFHCDGPNCDNPDRGPWGWNSTLRFSVAPDPDPSPQAFGNPGVKGNYNGLDYMLFHNLAYLLNPGIQGLSDDFPRAHAFPCLNDPEGTTESPLSFTNTHKHINVDNTNITSLEQHCLTNKTYYGDVRIYGGSPGVTITNTKVNSGGRLHVSCINTCGLDPNDYIFKPSSYMKKASNNNNNGFVPYVMTAEFKNAVKPATIISPNPNSGLFTLSLDENAITQVFIYNNLGALIYWQEVNSSRLIDISLQPKGIYFVKVQGADTALMRKIVVQ